MKSSLLTWALIPPILWMTLITIGLVTSPAACAQPATVNLAGAGVLLIALMAVLRVTAIRRRAIDDEVPAFAGNVAMLIAALFTAGIALTWAMVGLGPCM